MLYPHCLSIIIIIDVLYPQCLSIIIIIDVLYPQCLSSIIIIDVLYPQCLSIIIIIDVLYPQCEGLLEEHDEEIIGLLRKSVTDDLLTKICVDLTSECHLHAPLILLLTNINRIMIIVRGILKINFKT